MHTTDKYVPLCVSSGLVLRGVLSIKYTNFFKILKGFF
jgi:hypothetical protein